MIHLRRNNTLVRKLPGSLLLLTPGISAGGTWRTGCINPKRVELIKGNLFRLKRCYGWNFISSIVVIFLSSEKSD